MGVSEPLGATLRKCACVNQCHCGMIVDGHLRHVNYLSPGKRIHRSTQVFNMHLLVSPFNPDLGSLWSRSNLHASQRKFFTVRPSKATQSKFCRFLLGSGKTRKHVNRNKYKYAEVRLPCSRTIFCFWKQRFSCGKTGKQWGNMRPLQMFLDTCFLVLPGAKYRLNRSAR